MNITIKINTDNAAFEGDNLEFEVERILVDLSRRIASRGLGVEDSQGYTLRDINGNWVGDLTAEE